MAIQHTRYTNIEPSENRAINCRLLFAYKYKYCLVRDAIVQMGTLTQMFALLCACVRVFWYFSRRHRQKRGLSLLGDVLAYVTFDTQTSMNNTWFCPPSRRNFSVFIFTGQRRWPSTATSTHTSAEMDINCNHSDHSKNRMQFTVFSFQWALFVNIYSVLFDSNKNWD